MPKTSMSWKSIWIYLQSQIQFPKFISTMDPEEWCHVCVFIFIPAESKFEINFETGLKMFRFKLNFQISKLDLRFQINSNKFSRHWSFGHYFSMDAQPEIQILHGFHSCAVSKKSCNVCLMLILCTNSLAHVFSHIFVAKILFTHRYTRRNFGLGLLCLVNNFV